MWLNEGFASWIEYLCVDHCFPEYDIWTQFVSADYTRALDLDALDNSHPIEVRMSLSHSTQCVFPFISAVCCFSIVSMDSSFCFQNISVYIVTDRLMSDILQK